MIIHQEEIAKSLAHKPPFLFVDEIEIINNNKINASYLIKKNEYFFKGHFPNNPIVPGVILIEMLSQASLAGMILIGDSKCLKYKAYFSKVSEFVFKKPVFPMDKVFMNITFFNSLIDNFFEIKGVLMVNNEVKARGDIILYFKN